MGKTNYSKAKPKLVNKTTENNDNTGHKARIESSQTRSTKFSKSPMATVNGKSKQMKNLTIAGVSTRSKGREAGNRHNNIENSNNNATVGLRASKMNGEIDKQTKINKQSRQNYCTTMQKVNDLNASILADAIHLSVEQDEDLLDYEDDIHEVGLNEGMDDENTNDRSRQEKGNDHSGDVISTCSATLTDEQEQLLSNPGFSELLQKLVNDKVEKTLKQRLEVDKQDKGRVEQDIPNSPFQNKRRRTDDTGRLIKSPSDTTLYTPALKRANLDPMTTPINTSDRPPLILGQQRVSAEMQQDGDITNQVSRFIEGIRL